MVGKVLCVALLGFVLVQSDPLWRRGKRSSSDEDTSLFPNDWKRRSVSHKRETNYNDIYNDYCGKGLKEKTHLDNHIKANHTKEHQYKCRACTTTFFSLKALEKHNKIIHKIKKLYACEICGKAFKSSSHRAEHRFIHSDKKRYECSVCGTGFMRKSLCYVHMKTEGHFNDVILVNTLRLTRGDDQLMNIQVGGVKPLMVGAEIEHLDITEFKNSVSVQRDDDRINEMTTVTSQLDITELKNSVIVQRDDDSINEMTTVQQLSSLELLNADKSLVTRIIPFNEYK